MNGKHTALRVVTAVWASLGMIQLAIWVLILIIGGHVASLWMLGSVGIGGVIVGAMWWMVQTDRRDRGAIDGEGPGAP